MSTDSIFELAAGVQSYDWGVLGEKSTVAQFAQGLPDFQVDKQKPYAELWMGTHPSKPSVTLDGGKQLAELLKQNPSLLGDRVRHRYQGDDLPYLFKVLAVGKALSIQAHPDKKLGAKLHKEKPDIYKDPNHKPEMAIALTDFSGFCGFLPLQQIATYLGQVKEFEAVVGSKAADRFLKATNGASDRSKAKFDQTLPSQTEETVQLQQALKDLFSALMNADPETVVKPNVRSLVKRFKGDHIKSASQLPAGSLEELVLRLNEQFPDDVGIFCSFMLNVVTLKAGQAVFLCANEPHAYLQGDIIECMATSDNVVRAGLTPKLRDVPTLTSMLTYTWASADAQKMSPVSFKGCNRTKLYDPPIEEFSVALLDMLTEGGKAVHPPVDGPSIVIVTQLEGKGKLAGHELHRPGQVFFIGAGQEATFEGKLIAYRAYVEVPAEINGHH